MVEQHFQGNDHRVPVIKGEVVAVAQRPAAHVVGDGVRRIEGLVIEAPVAEVNHNPRRGDDHENAMTRIRTGAHIEKLLAQAGLTVQSVPAASQKAKLTKTLSSFSPSFEQSPGRLHLYDGHPVSVLLDYAHNPSGRAHREIYEGGGGLMAGASAGASVKCKPMLVSGHSEETHRVGELKTAPGPARSPANGSTDPVCRLVSPYHCAAAAT